MFFTVPQGVAGCVHVFLSWVAGPSCFVMYFSLYEPFCVTEAVSELDAAFWVGREVGPQESGHCKRMVLPRVDCRVYCPSGSREVIGENNNITAPCGYGFGYGQSDGEEFGVCGCGFGRGIFASCYDFLSR